MGGTVIPVGSGLAAQITAKDESTFGVTPSFASGADSFEMKSETLELKKTTVQGEGLAAGRVYHRTRRRVLTNYDVSGDIVMDLPTRNLGFWLRYMVGDFTRTPQQIGSTGLYDTVFQPVSTFYNHSFAVQKGVPAIDSTVLPFTYVGCKLSGWEISVATGAIGAFTLHVDGRNELAGSDTHSDPLNASVPALAPWNMPVNGLGASVFHFREANLLVGGTPTLAAGTATLTGAPSIPASTTPVTNTLGQTAMVTIAGGTITNVSVNGATVGTTAGTYPVPANQTISITYSAAPTWTWYQGVVSLAGETQQTNIKDCSLQQTFALDNERIFVGTKGFKDQQIENNMRTLAGSMTIEWLSSEAVYNAYADDTTTSLQLTFTGDPVAGSNYLLDFIVPNIKFEGESPKVAGPAVVTQAANFSGLDDETTIPLQVTYQSEDMSF